jgi:hypothetical protein
MAKGLDLAQNIANILLGYFFGKMSLIENLFVTKQINKNQI